MSNWLGLNTQTSYLPGLWTAHFKAIQGSPGSPGISWCRPLCLALLWDLWSGFIPTTPAGLLTYLRVCHEICKHSGSSGGRSCIGSSSRFPSRMRWGGGCRGWGGGALNDPVKPGLYVGVALEGSGADPPLPPQRALIFWCWRCVCGQNNGDRAVMGEWGWASTGSRRRAGLRALRARTPGMDTNTHKPLWLPCAGTGEQLLHTGARAHLEPSFSHLQHLEWHC